jgi:hypothetical protein
MSGGDARVAGLEVGSIEELNGLPDAVREGLYARLIPPELLARLHSERRGHDGKAHRLVRVVAEAGQPWARVEVRASPDDRDAVLLLDIAMSAFGVPELSFVQITDPTAERFGIDRDEDGQDTLFGTVSRNRVEEARALAAGLAPGQVRRGLGMLGRVMARMDEFCRLLGKELYLVEPLFYHSALLYERHGCAYLFGQDLMAQIHAEFQPGGRLHATLDGETVFRQPGLEQTARGRSWAIHDGILSVLGDAPWGGVKMYRQPGRPAGIRSFDGAY